jgi:hypothetical protein
VGGRLLRDRDHRQRRGLPGRARAGLPDGSDLSPVPGGAPGRDLRDRGGAAAALLPSGSVHDLRVPRAALRSEGPAARGRALPAAQDDVPRNRHLCAGARARRDDPDPARPLDPRHRSADGPVHDAGRHARRDLDRFAAAPGALRRDRRRDVDRPEPGRRRPRRRLCDRARARQAALLRFLVQPEPPTTSSMPPTAGRRGSASPGARSARSSSAAATASSGRSTPPSR